MKKIVICGGSLTPALALIESLEKKKNCQLIFFGREFATEGAKTTSVEYKEINDRKITFVKITAGRLQRKFTRYTITSLLKIPIGFFQALYFLIKYRPNYIISFGGYLSTPVVIAGWLLGIDSISHEQATIPGLATKINSIFSKKTFLTWPQSKKYFAQSRVEVIGNLSRKSIIKKSTGQAILAQFLKRNGNLIFVTGGNLGSHFLNLQVQKLVNKMNNYLIVHQVGSTNYQGDWDIAKKIKKINYLALEYLNDTSIGSVLNRADLIISRSGANTVWDIALLAKIAIFIPLPISASGEQLENAKILERVGSAKIIQEEDFTILNLEKTISQMLNHKDKYKGPAKVFSSHLPKKANEVILRYIGIS